MTHQRTIADTVNRGGASTALRDWKAVLILGALAALFFARILTAGAWLWEDMLMYTYPVRVFAATSLAMGQLPLWNPYTFNGMPFLADIQTTVLYLPCLALTLFVHDGRLAFYWLEVMVIAHYVLAGWAMYLLASSFDLKRTPALFAGIAYMLSGFMIVHAIHQQVITLVAWFPLILFLFRRALSTDGWRWVFACALLLGHSSFAGFPQLSLYFHSFLLVYFIFHLLTSFRGRALLSRPPLVMTLKAGVLVGLGLAIAMIQLLPSLELAGLSQRAQITYEKATEGNFAWSQMITFILPKFFGSAGAGGYAYWGPGTYWYYWETCMYLGILPLLLMILAPCINRRNPHVMFFTSLALFALLFALGNNFILHKLFYDYVPGFSTFRNPARMGVLFTFAASLLSAFALQALLYGNRNEANLRLARAVVLVVAGIGITLWGATLAGTFEGSFSYLKNPAALATVRSSAHGALAAMIASAIVVLGLILKKSWSRYAALLLIPVFFVDMFMFGGNQNNAPVNPADYFGSADPVIRFLRADSQNDLFRVNTRNQYGMIMDRNQGMIDRIPMMEGYTPLVLQKAYPPFRTGDQIYDLLNIKYTTSADPARGTLSLTRHPTYMPRAFFLYDMRLVRLEDELAAALKDTTWNHRTTAIVEDEPSLPIALHGATPVWAARITNYENNRIVLEVETGENGLLVLSEIYYPGWKVTVDGADGMVIRTDYNLRGVAVPSGSHRVEFRFVSPPFVKGAWISTAAILVCAAGFTLPAVRRSRQSERGR